MDITGNNSNNNLQGGDGNDAIRGGGGKDTLRGGGGDDRLEGEGGNDTLLGGNGNDTLLGGSDKDSLRGGDGNDSLRGGDGKDTLRGEGGNDTLRGENGEDSLLGGDGNDSLHGGSDNDTLRGEGGDDTLFGGDGKDSLHGGNGKDILEGGDGDDTLFGEFGDDTLFGEFGDDILFGLSDDDSLLGGDGDDTLFGEFGDDTLFGGDGKDSLLGGNGDDSLLGGNGDDSLLGGNGDDSLRGEAGDDSLRGEAGDDSLRGGDGKDSLLGGDGNDSLLGRDGNDLLRGEAGDDLLDGGNGVDSFDGGLGNDTVTYDFFSGSVNANLATGRVDFPENSTSTETITNVENLIGAKGNDLLVGNNDDNNLDGNVGNDTLNGESGNDLLRGGRGNDSLDGGNGFDTASYRGTLDEYDLFVEPNGTIKVTDINNEREGGSEGSDTLTNISRLLFNSESTVETVDITFGDANNDILKGSSNAHIFFGRDGNDLLSGNEGDDRLFGEDGNDTLEGEDGNDTLEGGAEDDILEGGAGDDILEGGAGDDILEGGAGLNTALYQGKLEGFDITINDDESITLTDNDLSDGDEGTDTLTNISQLSFGGSTRLGADNDRSTVLGIAGVHESTNNTDTSTSIFGGSAAATNFVIDIEGTTGFGLDFDTNKLANFINDITLPDQDIENQRLANNLLLDAAGGIAGSLPIFGSALSTGVAIQQTLTNYGFDLAQVEAQKQAAIDAVNNPDYDTSVFGTITETNRDLVLIEDFQIGVDNLFLPSVSNVANVGYATKTGTLNSQEGVFIEAQIGNETSNLVFIVNNYAGEKNKTEFGEEITNLLGSTGTTRTVNGEQITEFSGTAIGTFNQTPIKVEPLQSRGQDQLGTFAGDHIIGRELNREPENSESGSFEFIGRFGDDLLQGGSQDDLLYGGFNSDAPTFDNITYEDDGFDILQGGRGDDLLSGGSGNDTLDGGGLIYDDNINVTGVIGDDGTDRLIGGSGNDTFVFNTASTGIDTITDFTVLVDKIQINGGEFGATDNSQFSFDQTNGALSFDSQQFATLENFGSLQDFDVNRDIQLV